jgi:hypothetical protein
MKLPLRVVVLATALGALLVTTMPAQSSPSLEDTLNWLKDFLPNATGAEGRTGGFTQRATTSLEVMDGCRVRLTHDKVTNGQHFRDAEEFSLGDVDPATANVGAQENGAFRVDMFTRGGSKTVTRTQEWDGFREKVSYVEGGVFFSERGSAERVAKAYAHAADLCGEAQPF